MAKAWKIAPGEGADQWEMCRDKKCIALGWRKLKNYLKYNTEQEIQTALGGGPGDGSGAAQSIWRFAREIQPSDLVIANNGRSRIEGVGIVSSDYLPPRSRKNPSVSEWLPHARLVDWVITKDVEFDQYVFAPSTVHSLSDQKLKQIRDAYLREYPDLSETWEDLLDGIYVVDDGVDAATSRVIADSERQLQEFGTFEPSGIKDARERVMSSIVQRRGQSAFRKRLMRAYDGRCAVTECDVASVLEAAHIVPYKGAKTNHPANGLLLRADLHTLFDLGLIAIDADSMRLLVSKKLQRTEYAEYHGHQITVPSDLSSCPSRDALEQHRRKSGLRR